MQGKSNASGLVLVAIGAALWGTDALFRRGLAQELPPTVVVAGEHLILTLILLPVLWSARHALRRLGRNEWVAVIVIGAGSSALATVLFTSAFSFGDPNTPLLLQKLQPIFAVVAASLILGERIRRRFFLFLAGGMIGAFFITFPDPTGIEVEQLAPALLATGAALLWGLGTVLGRRMASFLQTSHLTAIRLAIGLVVLVPIVIMRDEGQAVRQALESASSFLLLALVPGLLALLLYYRGLKTTPASAATIAELAFPIAAVSINYLAFGAVLRGSQWMGLGLLSATIISMAWIGKRTDGAAKLGVVVPKVTAGHL